MGATSMSAPTVEVGTKLRELSLYGDPTFIVSTAIATRDYQDVHHDRDKAQAKESKDSFVNILTDTGLVQRYVTDWAGPTAIIKSISLRLGLPWYAYDTVVFRGEVTAIDNGLITLRALRSRRSQWPPVSRIALSRIGPSRNVGASGSGRCSCGWWRTPPRQAWTTRSRIRTAFPLRRRRWR